MVLVPEVAFPATKLLVAGKGISRDELEGYQVGTSTRGIGETNLDDLLSKHTQQYGGTGSGVSNQVIFREEFSGGTRYRFAVESTLVQPSLEYSFSESAPSMLAKVKSIFALNVSDLAKVLGVERPTVYAWMDEKATPHRSNRERLEQVFDLAQQSEKWLVNLPRDQVKRFRIQNVSIAEFLSQEQLSGELLLAGLEDMATSTTGQEVIAQKKKVSLRDVARQHGIQLPSQEATQDTFDLVTGKRTDPEVE